MLVATIVVAAVLVLAAAVLTRRIDFGDTPEVDRVRRVDTDAAARVEVLRAEHGIRGGGMSSGGFGAF